MNSGYDDLWLQSGLAAALLLAGAAQAAAVDIQL
jgi:hypothetical protein